MRAAYQGLLAQIRQLSAELLPATNPTARYTKGEILRMIAFRLSAHAEIERFLEECAESLATHMANKNQQQILSPIVQKKILMCSYLVEHYPPRSITFTLPTDANKRIRSILNVQLDIISGNNGLSEKDVLKMFVPLGIELSHFDEHWLISLNALARSRGQAAHNSWLSSQPNPVDERRLLVLPVLGIRRLLEELDRLHALA